MTSKVLNLLNISILNPAHQIYTGMFPNNLDIFYEWEIFLHHWCEDTFGGGDTAAPLSAYRQQEGN